MKNVRFPALMTAAMVLAAVPAAFADKPVRLPNSTPYKVTEGQRATGRSGNATLTATAMANKSGAVELHVVTGAQNSTAVGIGNITKVQVKSFGGNGEEVLTKNYNGLNAGGTFTQTYTDLVRGQPFQVQANIKGIDRNRTDVVTVSGNVRLRPDLSVTRISVPARAAVGMPVMIMATVEELNTEVGANTDCVLSVDGVAVDEAKGIWVDAGGIVTCAFTHVFPTVGVKALAVSLQNSRPADYDAANDGAQAQVEIITPVQGMAYNAWVDTRTFDYGGRSEGSYKQADGSYLPEPDWVSSWGGQGWSQYTRINAWVGEQLPFTGTIVRVMQETNGAVVHQAEYTNLKGDWTSTTNGVTSLCTGRWDAQKAMHFYLCTSGGENPRTQVEYFREAGQVIYWSRIYGVSWHGGHQNYEYSMNAGQPVTLGADYRFRVELVRGDDVWLADTTVPLTPVNRAVSFPWRCWTEWTSTGREGRVCSVDHDNLDGFVGAVTNY